MTKLQQKQSYFERKSKKQTFIDNEQVKKFKKTHRLANRKIKPPYKKEGNQECSNYNDIILENTVGKMYAKILEVRPRNLIRGNTVQCIYIKAIN